MAKVIGIDLGTTNSCVAVMEGTNYKVIENSEGARTTPSMVGFTKDGERLVGQPAKRQAVTNPEGTLFAVKRLMGRRYDDPMVTKDKGLVPFKIVKADNGDAWVEVENKKYSPSEVSAMILTKMKETAESYLGEKVTQAVITVPAYFNDNQRQATKDAGAIAGLDVIRIINEPTAAALAYGFGKNIDKTVAVFDLGGGTFDISILEISSQGVFKVIATTGDTFLGGEDFDARIIDWLVDGFQTEHHIDLREDRMALQRLRDAAEKAKCELSSMPETEINLPFIISTSANEALHLQTNLSRRKFEELSLDLIERTVEICRQALDDAQLETNEIEDVLLVGGMTRMPAIQDAVRQFFGRQPNRGVHPDEVVAMGAAIQGAALVEDKREMLLLDVTPHALGIMTFGSHFEELIPTNTTVPTSMSKTFTTSRDNQTAVKIIVMQGDSERAEENELLGEFILTGLRRAPRGEVEIDVAFEINTDGIVSVSAKDLETNQTQAIQVTASSGLTTDEIRQMASEARDFMVERKSDEAFEGARQRAETLIAGIESMFSEVEQTVGTADFGRDSLSKARGTVEAARRAIESRDAKAIREQLAHLERADKMFRGVVARN
jgi:molecular chaperone DnaK